VRGHTSTTAFVGRAAEADALVDAFTSAAAGQGTTALVGGDAGVGKSRLVSELSAHARRQGARVLVGQCLDLEEGGLPYAPVVDVLRTLDRELTPDEGAATLGPLLALLGHPASPEPPAATGPAGQARLFELLLTLIERLVATRPLVLVVEDLHWADRSTLDLVSLVASSTRNLPVLTVGTYRTEDVPPRHPLRPLTSELTRRGARHLMLERLGAGDVAELLGALLAAPPSAEVTASVVERSDGNPLFIEELAAALADDPAAPMPPHLRDAVISRVERMSDESAAVLRACAAGGREVEHDLLAQAIAPGTDLDLDLDPAVLDRALRACVDQRLLVADQQRGTYRFRHALVHEAVLDDILPGELHRLHRGYATALERRQAGSRARDEQGWARLAHHWDGAAEYDAALGAAVRAGRAAESAFAVPEAHRYLEWSVRLWDRALDPEAAAGCDRGVLLARAADAASRCGAMVRALTLVDEALATPPVRDDPVRAGLLHERRGWYLHRAGRADDALAAYELAVDLVPGRPATAARARVVQSHAHALVRAGRNPEARARAEEAIALARAVDDVVDEGQARHVLGLVLATEGRTDEAVATLHEAGQIAAGLGDLAEVAGAYVHLWRTLVEAGRGADLVDLVLAFDAAPTPPADPDAATTTTPGAAPTLMGSIGAAALHQLGQWDEADRLLGDARQAGGAGGLTSVTRTLVAGALAVDRGDHDQARDALETARAWCHQVGDGRLNGLLHRALAELAIWQGRYDDARREVAVGLDLLAHTGDPELAARIAAVGVRAEADRAERLRRVGRSARGGETERDAELVGERLVARLDALAATAGRRHAPPASEAVAAQRTGRAELTRFGPHPDPDRWREAVATWDAIGFPHPAAYARYRLGEAALAAGDAADAADALRAAWDTARDLGARPLADAVAHLARRARVSLPGADDAGGAGPERAPSAGAGLTPREREVLALVAEGRTNRQIGERLYISQKTASVHVSRLLAKLGASTRGEAAAIARRSGLLDDVPEP
jgi:DNA-binding CsgD family transcriptional regulator/tetratricopeptide (TPR) repeat protein